MNDPQPRNLLRNILITVLVLVGLYYLFAASYLMDDDSDPDRPPIIISSGSVWVRSGGTWADEGGKGFKQDFDGKSVKAFSATTGAKACTVEGKTIVVTYGTAEITFTRKRKWFWNKYGAFAQFPAAATVNSPGAGELEVVTNDTLVSFRNDAGDSCNVQAGTLTIDQKH